MNTFIKLLAFILLITSCNSDPDKLNRVDSLSILKDSTVLSSNPTTNAKDTLQNSPDSIVKSWFSQMLFALKEPNLKNYNGNKEIYRFTWLRTFHHPISVRIEKQGEIVKVFTKVCNGAGGYEPGKLIQNTTHSIKKDDYKKLLDKLSSFDFWNTQNEKSDVIGTDGSEWIIEAVKDNKYHVVSRWTPTKRGKTTFRDIGEYLISISTVKAAEIKDYY